MAIDLVSPAVAGHHRRVAYIAFRLAKHLRFTTSDQRDIIIASLLHDIGAFSAAERLDLLEFELNSCSKHSEAGAAFLARFSPFEKIGTLVRYHHTPWNNGTGSNHNGCPIPGGSHIIHLADRIEVLIRTNGSILSLAPEIRKQVASQAGKLFNPNYVAAFNELAELESFWFDLDFPAVDLLLGKEADLGILELDIHGLTSMARMFCHLIDFKSPFTATHSSGVAATAAALAELVGFSHGEQQEIAVAGLLHDIGKLAIPTEILEKPAKLDDAEFSVMQSHAYYSRRILESINDLATIVSWGSAHHERLDGHGYPFHQDNPGLPLGARVTAVADVFTALTEDRPYRPGMPQAAVQNILENMVADSKLDERIVTLLKDNYRRIDQVRSNAQQSASTEYESFKELVAADC